jgi:hypothetical protein
VRYNLAARGASWLGSSTSVTFRTPPHPPTLNHTQAAQLIALACMSTPHLHTMAYAGGFGCVTFMFMRGGRDRLR